jgi:TRAP transporter TAXI family solute receptor
MGLEMKRNAPSNVVAGGWSRRLAVAALLGFLMLGPAVADELKVIRLGTGGAGGTYFPIGTLVATGLTGAAGPEGCTEPASCGIPGVLAVAQVSNGSVANLESLQVGAIEVAFAQSNVIDAAYKGRGQFAGRPPAEGLRAIATLYSECLHAVVRAGAGATTIAALRGKRVSLDERGSGTLDDVREVLHGYGLDDADLLAEYIKPDLAVQRMEAGQLDAFFIVAGAPVSTLVKASSRMSFALLPIDGAAADVLLQRMPFYSRSVIPAGAYPGMAAIPTIAVSAQMVVRADLDEELVFQMTRALWSERTRKVLSEGHPKGRDIRLENALKGLSIPLHPGAERFYREIGILG